MKSIKIQICDFWDDAKKPEDNFFFQFLSKYYSIEISENPDFIIYSCFGKDFLKYDCTRIYYTPENIRPNFDECDYALTFDHISDPRHHRLPLYILSALDFNPSLDILIRSDIDYKLLANQKEHFCSFVYTNNRSKLRKRLFDKLSNYKSIASGGSVLKNTNRLDVLDQKYANQPHPWRRSKLEFIKESKFNIAFENESHLGYQSEKIMDAFLANCIPIYWGNPLASDEFNPKAFINAHDFNDLDQLKDYIIEIDNNEKAYLDMLAQPIFDGNKIPKHLSLECLADWFENVFNQDILPVAQSANKVSQLKSSFYHHYGKYAEKVFNRAIGKTKNFS